MREIVLDARTWKSGNNFYDAFFAAVGAPAWHGRNFDALNDSIGTGSINDVEVPYRIVLVGADTSNSQLMTFLRDLSSLLERLSDSGCPVELEQKDPV